MTALKPYPHSTENICKLYHTTVAVIKCKHGTNTRNIVLTRPKSAFGGIFDPIMTLTLEFFTPKFDTFIFAPKSVSDLVVKVWLNSVNKFQRYVAKNVCSGLTHARTDTRTL